MTTITSGPITVAKGDIRHAMSQDGAEQVAIGGGVAAAAGVGTAGYAVYARHDLPDRIARVGTAEVALADATRGVETARAAVEADRVHPPAGASAKDALEWVRGRFGSGNAITAFTSEGTAREVQVGRFGTPSRASGEALDAAMSLADGRGGGVVRAGEWHVPLRLTDDLDPLQKTRQVPYETVEYGYHHGPNPRNGGKYEYHHGPHTVTKYRTEQYLDPFTSYRSAHDGLDTVFTDDRRQLRLRGTRPELGLERARQHADDATGALGDAQRAVHFAERRAGTVRNVALGVAALGLGALAYGLVAGDD